MTRETFPRSWLVCVLRGRLTTYDERISELLTIFRRLSDGEKRMGLKETAEESFSYAAMSSRDAAKWRETKKKKFADVQRFKFQLGLTILK